MKKLEPTGKITLTDDKLWAGQLKIRKTLLKAGGGIAYAGARSGKSTVLASMLPTIVHSVVWVSHALHSSEEEMIADNIGPDVEGLTHISYNEIVEVLNDRNQNLIGYNDTVVILDEPFWHPNGEAIYLRLKNTSVMVFALGSPSNNYWTIHPQIPAFPTWEVNPNFAYIESQSLTAGSGSEFLRRQYSEDQSRFVRDLGCGIKPPWISAQ